QAAADDVRDLGGVDVAEAEVRPGEILGAGSGVGHGRIAVRGAEGAAAGRTAVRRVLRLRLAVVLEVLDAEDERPGPVRAGDRAGHGRRGDADLPGVHPDQRREAVPVAGGDPDLDRAGVTLAVEGGHGADATTGRIEPVVAGDVQGDRLGA